MSGRGHLLEASTLWTCQAALVLGPFAHEVNEPDNAAVLDYVVPHIGDHGFRQRPLEDEGGDEPWQPVGDGLLDHHGPDAVSQLDEAAAIEAEEGLEHVSKHVDVKESAAGPEKRQLLRHRELADAGEAVAPCWGEPSPRLAYRD